MPDMQTQPMLERLSKCSRPAAVTTCRKCGEPITPGYEFARIDGLDYCDECIDDMPYCELVPLLGGNGNTFRPEGL